MAKQIIMANSEKDKPTRSKVIGEILLDLGKLIFGGVVLAGIFDSSIDKTMLVLSGFAMFALLIVAGVVLVTKK